jgi:hypothetical protein
MLRPDTGRLPRLIPFKYQRTDEQVFTHRSFFARPTAVFEDPLDDIAPDNEVLEYTGDSVLSLAVVTLAKATYRTCARCYFSQSQSSSPLPHPSWLACWPTRRRSLLSLIPIWLLTCSNTSRKSDHLLYRMLRLRQFPSIMNFPNACAPTSPSWSAYSALYTCKVSLC